MTSKDLIANAKTLSVGATFHRCALQVNPQHYSATFRGKDTGSDASAHAKAIVDKAAEADVSVLAITDHNDVSGVPAFQDAGQQRGIHIFPALSCRLARASTSCASTLRTPTRRCPDASWGNLEF